jgi:tRNA dimethylallyltransferase
MLDRGFIGEVEQLLDQGYPPELPTMSAIGYSEVVQYLQGKISLEEAVTLMKRRTRTFVRRQANWFKPDDPRITWLEASKNLVDRMEKSITKRLKEYDE